VVRAGSYEFHTFSNCVDSAGWVSPIAYSLGQDNPESTESCAWWGMHASSPHSVHFTGIAAGRPDTKLSQNSKIVIVVSPPPHCARVEEVSQSWGALTWHDVVWCEVSNYASLHVTNKCVYRYFIKTFLFSVDNLDFITAVRVWPRKAPLIWLFIVYFTTPAVSQAMYHHMPVWLLSSEFESLWNKAFVFWCEAVSRDLCAEVGENYDTTLAQIWTRATRIQNAVVPI
jgi:hypothetical protein